VNAIEGTGMLKQVRLADQSPGDTVRVASLVNFHMRFFK
jgi:hypothetical protein